MKTVIATKMAGTPAPKDTEECVAIGVVLPEPLSSAPVQ